jgi:isochorismate hydrolase
MTTLPNRPRTALIVIDVQNGVVDGTPNRDGVVANINTLVGQAREQDVPVIWVQHNDDGLPRGSADWEWVAELSRDDSEPLVHKSYGDSFEATDLESVLAEREVGRLIVTGAESDACIRSTLHGAFTRGYDVTLVGDAHTTGDKTEWGAPPPEAVITHTNLYWRYQSAPGRTAGTVDTAEVSFAPASATLNALQHEVQAEIGQFRAADRLDREEAHDRAFH